MGEVGKEAGLEVRHPAQVVGVLIELRIESDHASIGVLQLAIEFGQLVLFLPKFGQRPQQLLVLALDFIEGICRAALAPTH